MTDENYSIVINDKVDSGIADKIRKIAENAIYADSSIEKLNATLRQLSGQSSVDKLASALLKMTSQSARVADQLSKLEVSNNKAALSEQKLATEFQKTQVAMLAVDTALNKTIASENAAALSAQKLTVEEARLSVETQRLVTEQQKSAAAAAQAQSAYQKAIASIDEAKAASQRLLQIQAQVAAAQANASTASIKQQTAMEQLAEATSRAGTAQVQGAVQAQRLATEQERTAAAAARTAAAQDRAAVASLRLQQAQQKAAQGTNTLDREAEQLRQSLNPLYAAQQAYNNEVQRALVLYKAGAINVQTYTQALNRSGERFEAAKTGADALDKGLVKLDKTTKLNKQSLVNLGFQIQDIGVSLASGQNPLTVFVQQGAQIAGIASQAGVSLGTMARAAAGLLLPFAPLVAALGVGYLALKNFQDEAGKNAGLKEYAKSLGATSKQIEKLKLDQITLGDTMRGFFDTIFPGEKLKASFDSVKQFSVNIVKVIATSVQSIIALFQAGFDVILEIWARLPVGFKKPIAEAINFAIGAFEKLTNFAIKGVNAILEGLNKATGSDFKPFENADFGQIPTDFAESNGKSIADTFVESYVKNLKNNQKATDNFMSQWAGNTAKAAKDRIKKELEKDKKEKTGRTPEERRADQLSKINAQLDNEAKRMFEIVNIRKVDAELDRIKEQFIGKGQPLNDNEVAQLRAKIEANQKALEVQKEFDSIYQESVGAAEKYGNTILAVTKLVEKGYISQEFANEQVRKAGEEYNAAINPLYAYNKAIEEQDRINSVSAKNRDLERQVIEKENLLKKAGKSVTDEMTAAIREEIKARNDRQRIIDAENSLQGSSIANQQREAQDKIAAIRNLNSDPNSGFGAADSSNAVNSMLGGMGVDTSMFQSSLDAQLEVYRNYGEQLAELNKEINGKKLLSDQEYANASLQLEIQKNNLYLNQANSFFGNLAGLQKSKNKQMASIGKAAAIAQTTINTYQAAMGAYASLSMIPIVGPALGAAAAAAAIVTGMQQVAQIRSQPAGYRQGGYTGNVGINEVAGVVHGKEFVMNAAATSRIGVSNLQALQRGAASVQTGGTTIDNSVNEKGKKTLNYNQTVNVTVQGRRDRRTAEQQARAVRNATETELNGGF